MFPNAAALVASLGGDNYAFIDEKGVEHEVGGYFAEYNEIDDIASAVRTFMIPEKGKTIFKTDEDYKDYKRKLSDEKFARMFGPLAGKPNRQPERQRIRNYN